MNSEAIQTIVIVGGGVVGWTAAAILARALKSEPIKITLLDLPGLPADDMAESSLPGIRPLHQMLGFDERQLMSIAGASFKLGTEYQGNNARSFIHPLGRLATTTAAFDQQVIRLHHAGEHISYDDFFLAAVAARHGKFAFPEQNKKNILSTLSCGLHLDVNAYKKYLRDYAHYLQVTSLQARVQGVALCPDSGFINAVVLDDNTSLSGDLFIDCSGEMSVLIGDPALAVDYCSWAADLPVDRVMNFSIPYGPEESTLRPLTSIQAMPVGWKLTIPLQQHRVQQYIYHSNLLGDETLLAELQRLGLSANATHTSKHIRPGHRTVWWKANCVAIGTAAGNITSLAISELQWAQSALVRLLDYFPHKACKPCNTAEYNRLSLGEFERLRDFHIAHQLLLHSDSAFGRLCQEKSPPITLQHRLDLFRHRGRIGAYEYDVISDQLWAAFFLGLNCWPERYDIMTDSLAEKELLQQHQHIRQAVQKTVDAMPNHHEVLARYCPAR